MDGCAELVRFMKQSPISKNDKEIEEVLCN